MITTSFLNRSLSPFREFHAAGSWHASKLYKSPDYDSRKRAARSPRNISLLRSPGFPSKVVPIIIRDISFTRACNFWALNFHIKISRIKITFLPRRQREEATSLFLVLVESIGEATRERVFSFYLVERSFNCRSARREKFFLPSSRWMMKCTLY